MFAWDNRPVTEDWTTVAGLREIANTRAARIPGWRAPAGFAVGYLDSGEWVFPHVNKPGSPSALSAVLLAELLGYAGGTGEYRMTATQLAGAIAGLAPAEATAGVKHANLTAWRTVAAAGPHEVVAVFVAAVGDPVAGPADAAMRALW